MVMGSIFLGMAAGLVWAAITSHRQMLLFLAVAFYSMLAILLAFNDLTFLVPATLLAVGLELYGLGLILRGGLGGADKDEAPHHNRHKPA